MNNIKYIKKSLNYCIEETADKKEQDLILKNVIKDLEAIEEKIKNIIG